MENGYCFQFFTITVMPLIFVLFALVTLWLPSQVHPPAASEYASYLLLFMKMSLIPVKGGLVRWARQVVLCEGSVLSLCKVAVHTCLQLARTPQLPDVDRGSS